MSDQFPIIQVRIGSRDITTIPPENIVSFTIEDDVNSPYDKATFNFFDPTYVEFDNKVMFITKKQSGKLKFRWGYPSTIDKCQWREVLLDDYIPDITDQGMSISMEGRSYGYLGYDVGIVEPKTYKGSISDVAKQVAKDLKFDDKHIFVEQTDDIITESMFAKEDIVVVKDVVTTHKGVWATGNLTLVEFVEKKLRPAARSEKNPGDYKFRITSKGEFHFHTESYDLPSNSLESKDYVTKDWITIGSDRMRVFTFMFGMNNNNISWRPEYYPNLAGHYIREILKGTFDPYTKRFIQESLSQRTLAIADKKDKKLKTVVAPINNSDSDTRKRCSARIMVPCRPRAMGGKCSGKKEIANTAVESSTKEVASALFRFQRVASGGTITVYHTPDDNFMNIRTFQDRYCFVKCVLPDGTLHWSSGYYFIDTITHEIDNVYRVVIKVRNVGTKEGPKDITNNKKSKNTIQTVKVI